MLISLKGDHHVKFITRKIAVFRYVTERQSMKSPNSNAFEFQYFKNSISFPNT